MIQNRDTFLQKLAGKYGRPLNTNMPGPVEVEVTNYASTRLTDLTRPELLKNYVDYCRTLGIKISVVKAEEVVAATEKLVAEYGGGPVILNDDKRLADLGIIASMQSHYPETHVWNSELGRKNIEFAAEANVGIVYAEHGLVESGGIVLESGPTYGRSVSLLPKVSIVVLKASTVLPRVHQVAVELDKRAQAGERMPSVVNLISGPSSTADIELVKVVGVHGPTAVGYVLIDDDGSCAEFHGFE